MKWLLLNLSLEQILIDTSSKVCRANALNEDYNLATETVGNNKNNVLISQWHQKGHCEHTMVINLKTKILIPERNRKKSFDTNFKSIKRIIGSIYSWHKG